MIENSTQFHAAQIEKTTREYREITLKKDFAKELKKAVACYQCLLCKTPKVIKEWGICQNCASDIKPSVLNKVEKLYTVNIKRFVSVAKIGDRSWFKKLFSFFEKGKV